MSEITPVGTSETLEKAMTDPLSVILKHSYRCPVSKGAKNEFEKFARDYDGEAKLYYVDIIAYRNISSDIESRTGIIHKSPQVIILKSGKPVWSDSHWRINATALTGAIEEL